MELNKLSIYTPDVVRRKICNLSILRSLGKDLEIVFTAIPQIRVSAITVRIRVLPEALVWPTARDGADGTGVLGQHQRIILTEVAAVARTCAPPVGRGIDHGIPTRLAFVSLTKVTDPGYHVRGTKPVASGTRWIVLDIQHAGQSNAIVGPTTTVGQEEVCLIGARAGIGVSEVIATTNETGAGCAFVVAGERAVGVCCTFGGLFLQSVGHHAEQESDMRALTLIITKRAPEL